jgi:arsenite transporter
VLIWLMIIPMLLKIDFARWQGAPALARRRRHAVHQLGGQAVLDGGARLALHRLPVRPMLPPIRSTAYIAGLIILAAAPCTAMVFVWSNLSTASRISR